MKQEVVPYCTHIARKPTGRTKIASDLGKQLWSQLVSNQRPLACEASALPLSYGTG